MRELSAFPTGAGAGEWPGEAGGVAFGEAVGDARGTGASDTVGDAGGEALGGSAVAVAGGPAGGRGGDGDVTDGQEDKVLAQARLEKELLAMRLEAMTTLLELQEEAFCTGSDAALPDPECAPSIDRDPDAKSVNGVGAPEGEGQEAMPAGLEGARALVRGWRIKANELLLSSLEAKDSARRQVESNLEALEVCVCQQLEDACACQQLEDCNTPRHARR